jgi:hypothetical protein
MFECKKLDPEQNNYIGRKNCLSKENRGATAGAAKIIFTFDEYQKYLTM